MNSSFHSSQETSDDSPIADAPGDVHRGLDSRPHRLGDMSISRADGKTEKCFFPQLPRLRIANPSRGIALPPVRLGARGGGTQGATGAAATPAASRTFVETPVALPRSDPATAKHPQRRTATTRRDPAGGDHTAHTGSPHTGHHRPRRRHHGAGSGPVARINLRHDHGSSRAGRPPNRGEGTNSCGPRRDRSPSARKDFVNEVEHRRQAAATRRIGCVCRTCRRPRETHPFSPSRTQETRLAARLHGAAQSELGRTDRGSVDRLRVDCAGDQLLESDRPVAVSEVRRLQWIHRGPVRRRSLRRSAFATPLDQPGLLRHRQSAGAPQLSGDRRLLEGGLHQCADARGRTGHHRAVRLALLAGRTCAGPRATPGIHARNSRPRAGQSGARAHAGLRCRSGGHVRLGPAPHPAVPGRAPDGGAVTSVEFGPR